MLYLPHLTFMSSPNRLSLWWLVLLADSVRACVDCIHPVSAFRQIGADSLLIAFVMAQEAGRIDCRGTTLMKIAGGYAGLCTI